MNANEFLTKIKANGNSKDWDDLSKVQTEFNKVLPKLSTKDRGNFSLNVLCLLCRNLDKVPSWTDAIDSKDLLILSIDCIRETRGLNKPEQVKTLACIYHIHRYVVRKNAQIPPELILKISYMAYENDTKNLLKEYCKTYWNILVDRLAYFEKLRGKSIHKLLPKLTEDLLKTIDMYDTVPFCTTILVFLFKKLHSIFSGSNSEQLNIVYGEIFKKLSSKSDLNAFKKLNDTELQDIYVKISDCLYVVAENASKNKFKNSSLSIGIRTAIMLLGHRSDIFHCLQTFYLNSFCDLFENKTTYIDCVFKNVTASCEITEKLGYKTIMRSTYPYLNQFLRLFIEYSVTYGIEANFAIETQESCLNCMLKIINMLKCCPQLLKCENCNVKSGLHDSLRLSFLFKNFITKSLEYNLNITSLVGVYNKVVSTQYNIIYELKSLNCYNYNKFYLKLQTDTHNIAILLNRHQKYEFSINLFDAYIKNELKEFIEYKNLARAFYNKSICELDCKKYKEALLDAYLGMIFAQDVTAEKYMSLVMDIKAKSLKDDRSDESDQNDHLQMITVIDACKIVIKKQLYGDLMKYLKTVQFSTLLKHEFTMYAKLWPSIVPVAGVWKSLYNILEGNPDEWFMVEDEDTILWALLDVVSITPSVVRTIHNEYFKDVVLKLLDRIEKMADPVPINIKVAQTLLLFLKAEYDLADASAKYGWKVTEMVTDLDQIQISRTIQQEHSALQSAIQAVELWTEIVVGINTVSKATQLLNALQLADIFVNQLLYFSRLGCGLQLAHICCVVSKHIEQKDIYIRNAGVLAYHIETQLLQEVINCATDYWTDVAQNKETLETAFIFISDIAIYYHKCGTIGTAAMLVQFAQIRILKTYENMPDINLDLAVGRLMEAQALICKDSGPSTMTAVNGLQRHYLAVVNNGASWAPRRLLASLAQHRGAAASALCAARCRGAGLVRRARAAAGGAARAPAAALARTAARVVDTHNLQQAQVTIDNRLKYILGLSTEQPLSKHEPKIELFAPKQDLEVMLESQPLSLSPTRKYVQIPGYQTPEFLKHNNCNCYACDDINCAIITYIIGGLEASMYFRANEIEIARNYYKGVITNFDFFNKKLEYVINKYTDSDFEKYVVNYVKNVYENEFRTVKLEILIEATYFELKCKNFDKADDNLVTIHEILQDVKNPDDYMSNEVLNLMIASAKVRNTIKKHENTLESEFENLKISPKGDIPKTPISKPMQPVLSSNKITVNDEAIPKKRKVIKLNLDDGSSDEKDKEKPKTRKPVFKVPVPVTSKHVLESITPRVVKKPEITITNTETPTDVKKDTTLNFFTPKSTPEQFFTPLNTIKSYSKTNLRRGIVKNLEEEFSTPLGKEIKKENSLEVPTRSVRKEKERTLRRATSPGKLSDSSRPRRLRQPKLNE